MMEFLRDPICWLLLLLFYLGTAVSFIGQARNNNTVISGFGIIISLGSVIYSMIYFTWWFGIFIGFVGYLTSLFYISIPVILGYIYWKIRYNPRYLTLFRFHGLIFEQYMETRMMPITTYIFIDKAVSDGIAGKEELMDYAEEVFSSESKFVSEELFSSYEIFKEYIIRRKAKGFDYAINMLKRELGIVPMTKLEVIMKIDDMVHDVSKNRKDKNK